MQRLWRHFLAPSFGECQADAGGYTHHPFYCHSDIHPSKSKRLAAFPRLSWRAWCAGGTSMKTPGSAHRCLPPGNQPLAERKIGRDGHHGFPVSDGEHDPQTTLEMAKLLLNTAETHLQEEVAANQLLGWNLYDLLVSDKMLLLSVVMHLR